MQVRGCAGAAGAGAGDDHLERGGRGAWPAAAGRRPAAVVLEGLFDQVGEVGVVLGAFIAAGSSVIGGASCRVRPAAGKHRAGCPGKCAERLMAVLYYRGIGRRIVVWLPCYASLPARLAGRAVGVAWRSAADQ